MLLGYNTRAFVMIHVYKALRNTILEPAGVVHVIIYILSMLYIVHQSQNIIWFISLRTSHSQCSCNTSNGADVTRWEAATSSRSMQAICPGSYHRCYHHTMWYISWLSLTVHRRVWSLHRSTWHVSVKLETISNQWSTRMICMVHHHGTPFRQGIEFYCSGCFQLRNKHQLFSSDLLFL